MPPIDLPPETPQEALWLERFRHSAAVCPWTAPEHGERPHGGEPVNRLARFATATSSTFTVFVDDPYIGSASNRIIEGILFDRQPVIRLTAADYGRA